MINTRPTAPRTVPGEIIVKLARHQADTALLQSQTGGRVVEEFHFPVDRLSMEQGQMVRVKLADGTSVEDTLEQLRQDDEIVFAEPNYVYSLDEAANPPNDLHEKLWGLDNQGQTGGTVGADVNISEAWKVSTGSKGPLISVIDSGIDYNHPDLAANMWINPGEIPGDGIDNDGNGVVDDVHGYNAYADNGDPMDGFSHGTHCAGTIAAVGNNSVGVTGVMQEAQLMAVKIFSDSGSTSTDAILRGLAYSARMGAQITSNSWGGPRASEAIKEAFESHPGLHVIAAGNGNFDNDRKDNFPSNYDLDNIVAVAATDHNDNLANFSCYGATSVDIAAPGVNILSTVNGGGYKSYSGTSMATPHVAGAALLVADANPGISNEDLKARLLDGADEKSQLNGKVVTGARLNVANAIAN